MQEFEVLQACGKLFSNTASNDDMKFIYEKLKQLTMIAEDIEDEASKQDSNNPITATNYEYLYDDMRSIRSQIRMYSKSLFPEEPNIFNFFNNRK